MKNKILTFLCFFCGILFVLYDFLSILINPGIFIDNLRAFSNVWLIPGGYLIFAGIYRIKRGHSFWSVWKKWVKLLVCVCFGFGIVLSCVNLGRMQNAVWADESVNPDCVILLGGGIRKDGTLPKAVRNRVEAAADYLLLHEDVVCVVSGGARNYQPYPEAPALKAYLMEKGIEEDRILVDAKALDTIQNLENSARLLCENQDCQVEDILKSNVVLVSSRFHIKRAERIALRLGFENVYGVGAKIPFISVLNSYAREILSYVKLDLRILLTGKPERM